MNYDRDNLILILKVLLTIDDIDIIKYTIESLIEELEDKKSDTDEKTFE